MLIKKQYVYSLFSFFLALFYIIPGFSQTKSQSIESIGIMSPLDAGNDELNKEVSNYFAGEIRATGKEIDWNSRCTLFVSAANISNDMVAVNVVYMSSLPKEVLNFNAKNEVFYLNIAKKQKLTPEGKNIREHVTKDYIKEFKRPGGAKWIICKKSDLKNECKKFIDDFMNDGWKSIE